MAHKQRTSFTLSPEALRLLSELAARLGLSKAGVLELIIRERARAEGLEVREGKEDGR